jgi:ribosomal protein S18 acetylase RimI-like enzyme
MKLNRSEIKVTALAIADRADWEVLYHGYAVFYKVPMDERILETVWNWIHDDYNPFYGLIAKNIEGQALGLMHCRQMPSPLRGAQVGFLDDLFVQSEARGQGVVDALYDALNQLGKQQGWPFIRWITAENNYRGRAVYDKLSEKTHWITYQKPVQ